MFYGRHVDEGRGKKPLVSRPTPCKPPPSFSLFTVSYSCPPSHLGPPMCPHRVQIFLDGVIRPGKSQFTCLIPCPHAYPITPIPFAPAPPQDFSPSFTIHTHAPPMILGQWHHYIHHARHPPPHAHPFAFFDL